MADDKKTQSKKAVKNSYTFTKLGLVIEASTYAEAQALAQETEEFKTYVEAKENK